MNHRQLVEVTRSYESTVDWLMERNYIPKDRECPVCRFHQMRISPIRDTLRWKCNRCSGSVSLFEGTIFHSSKKELRELMDLVYFWCLDVAQVKVREEVRTKSKKTVCSWYSKLQRLAYTIIKEESPAKIGGPGHIVEIDESKFSKRKYNVGRVVVSPWVVGGIDTTTGQTFFVEVGTVIHTDCWGGYVNLGRLGYVHRTVNHTTNFVDPETGANTQKIENSWCHLKRKIRARNIVSGGDLALVFGEFLFKRRYGKMCFEKILENLRDSLNKIDF